MAVFLEWLSRSVFRRCYADPEALGGWLAGSAIQHDMDQLMHAHRYNAEIPESWCPMSPREAAILSLKNCIPWLTNTREMTRQKMRLRSRKHLDFRIGKRIVKPKTNKALGVSRKH